MNPLTLPSPPWLDRAMFPYDARFVPVPGGQLAVTEVGEGPPVLLVHGTPTWSVDWRHLIPALSASHRVIAPDHLGFGRSPRVPGAGYAPEDHARRFAALADTLDLRDLTLVIHDFGGPIALPWALANRDRLRRLVVINSFGFPFTDPAARMAARVLGSGFGRFLYRYANLSVEVIAPTAWGDRRKLTPALHRQWRGPFVDRGARVEVLWPLARSLLSSEAHYEAILRDLPRLAGVPVDLVWGLKDPAFPERDLLRWQALVPHATAHRIPESGHWPHEEAPEAVLRALLAAKPAGA